MSEDHAEDGRAGGGVSEADAKGPEVHTDAREAGVRPKARAEGSRAGQGRARGPLLAVGAIAAAYTGIFGRRHDDERLARWTDEQAIPTVALVSPQEGGGVREVVLPGNVEAFVSASIHGQTSGYVQEWRKDIGAQVHQGEVLAVVDTPELDQKHRGRSERTGEG